MVNPPRIDRSSSGTSMEDGRGKREEDFDVRWKKEDGRCEGEERTGRGGRGRDGGRDGV